MSKRAKQSCFTLIEVVMAIMILSVMMLMSFFCFDAVVQSWTAGIEVSDAMGQADHVMEQLVSGLRSAYYPDAGSQLYEYGFQLYDNGEDAEAMDSISWVKLGSALVGEDCGFAESPHRITVSVSSDEDAGGLRARAWRVDLQLDEFDPQEDVMPLELSPRVIAFNCRVLDKDQPEKDDEPNWQDEWATSNCIPKAVELALYMEPPDNAEDDEPIEVKRIVTIPLWDISQNPRDKSNSSSGKRGTGGGGVNSRVPPSDGRTPPMDGGGRRPDSRVTPDGRREMMPPGGLGPGGGMPPGGGSYPPGGGMPPGGRGGPVIRPRGNM